MSILVHCCNKDTGGLPSPVASCTLSNCSFCDVLSFRAWDKATAAYQLERGSWLNRPPHSNWPAVTACTVKWDADGEISHKVTTKKLCSSCNIVFTSKSYMCRFRFVVMKRDDSLYSPMLIPTASILPTLYYSFIFFYTIGTIGILPCNQGCWISG